MNFKIEKNELEKFGLDYELLDNKALLFKSDGKIVIVFDLKDKTFLKSNWFADDQYLVNGTVLLPMRTDDINRNIEYVSIVDLKNKKYLKDIFTFNWYYKDVVDAYGSYDPGRDEYSVLASHSEKVWNGDININDNLIEYVYENKGKKKVIIYDTNTGKLIHNQRKNLDKKYVKTK